MESPSASGSLIALSEPPVAQSTGGQDTSRYLPASVVAIHHWTQTLLSFRTTRPEGFRFTPGHYARLGLRAADGRIVWRPFSLASAAHEDDLEFLAILVDGGEFSGLLAAVGVGDTMLVEKSCYGFLTIAQFAPGRDLWLIASGTGVGPYVSILRDPATWKAYDKVIVVHSVRYGSELAYREEIAGVVHESALCASTDRLRYVPVVTREPLTGALDARIPRLIEGGRLEQAAGIELDPARSRVMVCGNPEMARELRAQFTARGFRVNRRAAPGQLAFENYWT